MLRLLVVLVTSVALGLVALSGGAAGAERVATPFPVTVTTPVGKVTLTNAPRRIVSLSPSATETLFAIGAGKQVIAVDDQSDYPKTAPKSSLSGFTPNVEAIAGYKPDLVVISYDPKGLSDALQRLKVPVVMHGGPATLKGAYQQIRQLGRLTGNDQGASKLVTRLKERIAGILTVSKSRASGLSVYHELTPDYYSVSSKSFVGRVYELFGLANIADKADASGSGYPQLAGEYIVSTSPDVIVLADTVCCGQSTSTVAARPGWGSIKAVRSGSIVRIDDSVASRWGPRIVDFFRAVSIALARLRA